MVFEVKCANCNLYFPLDSVKQADNGYYCRACYKRLKNRQCVPITSNMEVRCARCDKIISPDEAKVKDGDHVYCLRCYGLSQVPPRGDTPAAKKPYKEPQYKCATCGTAIARFDDKIEENGKYYCQKCYERTRSQSVPGLMEARYTPQRGVTALRDADKLIECFYCGLLITFDQLKEDKDGKVHCPKCRKVLPIRFRSTVQEQISQSLKADDLSMKKEDYSAIAQLFKCLGDPCRVKIIELLSDHELCVFEFVEMTGFQYSAISYHLKMLKELGMIKSYERGNFMVYSLTEKGETVHEFIKRSKELS